MKHFISFQKKKGLFVPSATMKQDNSSLVHQLNHELMKYGFVMTKALFDRLAEQSGEELLSIYDDLQEGLSRLVSGGGYVATYANFPQSVLALSYGEFAINAILYYWTNGNWRPDDVVSIEREFKLEIIKYRDVDLISEESFNSIFTDLIYAPTSISAFDKVIVDWFISNGVKFDFTAIKFKETMAYVGKQLMENQFIENLPTRSATNVLRIYSAYSGGDEGLKENTKFTNPKSKQRAILSKTLNNCYDLEESFKVYREKWLRLLFYLNPMTTQNTEKYPELSFYANLLRNKPESLKTFASHVEDGLYRKDVKVLDLLSKRVGVFTRRLDHCVRVFGEMAIERWLKCSPKFDQLVTAYNHFTDRAKASDGRGAVLAGAGSSQVVTYSAQAPLDAKLVEKIKGNLLKALHLTESGLLGKRVFIDRSLYYRPLATNNRAASMSIDGKAVGTAEVVPAGKTIRMYVHWHDRHDIDLSALMLSSDNQFTKFGWNSYHHGAENAVVYSGDNTGHSSKNAEYMDITPDLLPATCEWIIIEARIFRGPRNFASFSPKTTTGWMLRSHPQAGTAWLPESVASATILNNQAQTAYVMAFHAPTRNIVVLDLGMDRSNVSGMQDAIKMRIFLDGLVTLDSGAKEVEWNKINQGHILHLLSEVVVEEPSQADLVFDENSTWESIAKYL